MGSAIITSSRGNAMIGALVAVTLSGVVGMSAIAYNNSFIQTSRVNYVRSAFGSVEANVRFMAMQPFAYACGREGKVANQLSDVSNCQLRASYFDAVKHGDVPGAQCDPKLNKTTCGFDLGNLSFTTADVGGVTVGVFSAQLKYEGVEVAIAPVDIRMNVPVEILQSQMFDCAEVDPTKPVFVGFNADGSPRCRGFADCPRGEYVKSLNFQNMTRTCGTLPPENDKLNCTNRGLDQPIITGMTWNNGVVSANCDSAAIPPMPTTVVEQPMPIEPPAPRPGCPDIIYNDPQGRVNGPGQNSQTNITIDFQSAVDRVPANCKYSSVTIRFQRFGVIGGTCRHPGEYTDMTPGGPSGSIGFINGGGSGNKTSYGTALVNGGRAYLTEASGGWGNAAGNSTAACIADVVVAVHSVPK